MNKIHFIGIGGIGMSALAQYYLTKGWQVSGSDLADSEIIQFLKKSGADIIIGHRALNLLEAVSRVIYSAAVTEDNPELEQARNLGAEVLRYAEALGELTRQYITVAVSGAHGKSTTAALTALMMIEGGLDPTVIIGTRLKEFGGANFRYGRSRYLVIEADEYNRSFLEYYPTIAVITNIDAEHLDTYHNLDDVVAAFAQYFRNVAGVGALITNSADPNSQRAVKLWRAEKQEEQAPKLISYGKKVISRWPLRIPGEFNQFNAEAAWQAAKLLGVSERTARVAVKEYAGSWRRLEQLAPRRKTTAANKQMFLSDYAHHPTEIKATIGALKAAYPRRKLTIVFQAHQLQRLNYLFEDFIHAFDQCDRLILLPAYQVAGREQKEESLQKNVHDLFKAIHTSEHAPESFYLKNFSRAVTLIKQFPNSVVVFMGAGDIDNEVRKYFKSKLLPV